MNVIAAMLGKVLLEQQKMEADVQHIKSWGAAKKNKEKGTGNTEKQITSLEVLLFGERRGLPFKFFPLGLAGKEIYPTRLSPFRTVKAVANEKTLLISQQSAWTCGMSEGIFYALVLQG